ncbi:MULTISPECIES: hypothetical protein [Serratia]|uniref:hypothetical protein n=2 Tax=Serratia TaxID=613 RepID=UPI0012B5BA29|nr:hypothetical protein [Serratia marcescens]MBH3284757.1 hypothetical protein [Serratia marcescens]
MMKITDKAIYNVFAGTKILAITSAVLSVLTTLALKNQVHTENLPLVFIVLFLAMLISGLIAMIPSPLTNKVAGLFDIKNSKLLCVIFTLLYFVLYCFGTGALLTAIIRGVFSYADYKELSGQIGMACIVVSIMQGRRFYAKVSKQ